MKLETIVEVFFQITQAIGSCRYRVLSPNWGSGSADHQLLNFLANQPNFDQYLLRIQPRNRNFSQPQIFPRPAAHNQTTGRRSSNHRAVGGTKVPPNFERSAFGAWNGMAAQTFDGMQELLRSYQNTINAIICALAVKVCRWMDQSPMPKLGNPARRIGSIMSEMRQGTEHIHSILGSTPPLAVLAAS